MADPLCQDIPVISVYRSEPIVRMNLVVSEFPLNSVTKPWWCTEDHVLFPQFFTILPELRLCDCSARLRGRGLSNAEPSAGDLQYSNYLPELAADDGMFRCVSSTGCLRLKRET